MKMRFFIMARMAGLVAILGLFTSVFASETFKPNNGAYGSISLLYSSIEGGSFNGDSVLEGRGSATFIAIPDLKFGGGFEIIVGARRDRSEGEIGFSHSQNNSTIQDPTVPSGYSSRKVSVNNLKFDYKLFFKDKGRIQAYGLAGFSVNWISVSKSSYFEDYYVIYGPTPGTYTYVYVWEYEGDVTVLGLGLDLGAGLVYFVNPRLSLRLGAFLRPILFGKLILNTGDLPAGYNPPEYGLSGMSGSQLGLTLGLFFSFKK